MSLLFRTATAMLAAILSTAPVKADSLEVRIGYVQWLPDQGPVLSNVLPEPEDAGLKGAELGMQDNSTCLLYTSPSPRDRQKSRMPSSA